MECIIWRIQKADDGTVGSFITGSKDDFFTQPGGLILQSVQNQFPVMVVEFNYRLGGKSFPTPHPFDVQRLKPDSFRICAVRRAPR